MYVTKQNKFFFPKLTVFLTFIFFRITDALMSQRKWRKSRLKLTIASLRVVNTRTFIPMLGPTSHMAAQSSSSLAHAEMARSVSSSRKSMALDFHRCAQLLYPMAARHRGSSGPRSYPLLTFTPRDVTTTVARYTYAYRRYIMGVRLPASMYVRGSRGGCFLTLHAGEGPHFMAGSSTRSCLYTFAVIPCSLGSGVVN